MTSHLPVTLIVGLLAQGPPQAKAEPDEAPARLAIMKKSADEYRLHEASDRAKTYKFQAEPVLRFTNTVGASKDGAVFLWLGEHDRPEVAAQVFLKRDGGWWHELSSLSQKPLLGEARGATAWNPPRGGVELKPIAGAPKPAETEEQRLRQMRAHPRLRPRRRLSARGWQTLRMLTKPFARYGDQSPELIDGALFCYVLTTDPEAYLLLEARHGKNGPEWQYGLAPMTVYPLRASLKGAEVWNLPYRFPRGERSE